MTIANIQQPESLRCRSVGCVRCLWATSMVHCATTPMGPDRSLLFALWEGVLWETELESQGVYIACRAMWFLKEKCCFKATVEWRPGYLVLTLCG